jgi:hypothetical protein
MNESTAVWAARIGGFLARHFLALLVTVAVPCVLWTVTYFALLLWAGFSGGGLGSPASYPLGLLFVLAAGTAASIILFLPSTALAEWFVRRRGLPVLSQVPIALALFAVLCLATVGVYAALVPQPGFRGLSFGFGGLFLVNLLPLGLYWWSAQGGPLLLSLLRRRYRKG